MKNPTPIILAAATFAALAQGQGLRSQVVHWDSLLGERAGSQITRSVIDGSTLDLESLQIFANTLPVSDALAPIADRPKTEKLLIVKSGLVRLDLEGSSQILTPGSVAVILPDVTAKLANADVIPSTYFLFNYISKPTFRSDGGTPAPTSFARIWEELEYLPSNIGGRRNNFDCPTAMMNRFEFHTSTLNAGLTNHQAHTHRAEEMVLVLKGRVEMMIGGETFTATAGDLFFIEAEILHSLRNVGDETTEYFAFQWM